MASEHENDEPMPAQHRRRRIDLYEVRHTIRMLATLGLMGIGGYTFLMAGLGFQAHL